ncbi:EF hand family protein [Trichomonas vaginalis G3]|uniref:EF hand family protein n=1 Tax=Trichomonas vaginalis (strain ATCC PRA-98 / G3) TaxID=412133 RepID=A2FKA1_TRIV3|nr:calcium ion binding [Trichomonas vaginalis G3]EAX94678.1 EF hand family protein [Trichomonas vaginalis G3]KAI5510190.1 calcium ion binding [Trichomonas vaginalis G3]|eukprot:XP_001307608.1 EF hand family protein [Trichomonas vaginalis G3]
MTGRRALTPMQLQEAKDAFDLFDTTGTNTIEQKELKIALMTLGFNISKEELRTVVSELDSSNTTTIDFKDFIQIVETLLPSRDPVKELTEAFNLFDIDHTGRITAKNIMDVVASMDEQLTEPEIHEIIAEADKRGEGDITLEEFIDLIKDNAIF